MQLFWFQKLLLFFFLFYLFYFYLTTYFLCDKKHVKSAYFLYPFLYRFKITLLPLKNTHFLGLFFGIIFGPKNDPIFWRFFCPIFQKMAEPEISPRIIYKTGVISYLFILQKYKWHQNSAVFGRLKNTFLNFMH